MRFLLFVICLNDVAGLAWAGYQDLTLLEQQVTHFVQEELKERPGVSFRVGRFDRRLALAPCARSFVNWAEGGAFSVRSFVEVSCLEPAWRVRLPVTMNERRMAVVLTRGIRAGEVLSAADIKQVVLPDQNFNQDVLTELSQALGQVMRSGAPAGAWLRPFMIRAPIVVKTSQRVRVVVAGVGFTVEGEGMVLADGSIGDVVGVRMQNGQIVRGTVGQNGLIYLAR